MLASSTRLDKNLIEVEISRLRAAVRKNKVSFPSQIPVFPKHTRPDLQQKIVQLYFIFGWSSQKIRLRYGLGRVRFFQILGTWKRRAIELGYIQCVPPATKVKMASGRSRPRIDLSAVKGALAPPDASSLLAPHGSQKPDQSLILNGSNLQSSYRPRRRCDAEQIVDVLKCLEAGHTVAEMSNQVGVSKSTIYEWKREHEIGLLRRENAELKERLTK